MFDVSNEVSLCDVFLLFELDFIYFCFTNSVNFLGGIK